MVFPAISENVNTPGLLDILYVEDDEEDARFLCNSFEKEKANAYQITHASTFSEALNQLKNKKFGAILLDLNLPDGKGLQGIDDIKNIYPDIPVVIITGHDDENTAIEALQKGAQEYIVKSHINNNIIKRVLQSSILRKQVEQNLKKKAYTDSLTGLPNRIAFEQTATKMIERAIRWQEYEALLFIDLNKFKEVNDTYGHEAGNAVLIEVSKRLQKTLRKSDLIARYAGDEFICYLDSNHSQKIDRELCQSIAQKIVHAVEQPILFENLKLEISLSIGIGIFPDAGKDFESLLNNADKAMYEAKKDNNKKFCFVEGLEEHSKQSYTPTDEWRHIISPDRDKTSNQNSLPIAPNILENEKNIREQIKKKFDEKFSEFAFMAAHDLRAPIRKVITFSELLETQYDELSEEERKHFLNRLSLSGTRLNQLIDNLLVFSNVHKNSETLQRYCLTQMMTEILDDLQLWLKESNVTVQVEALPKLLIYKTQIRQIFSQLILNAVNYRHPERSPHIHISYITDDNECVIHVKDNGIGINKNYKSQIFKPFKRLHSADQIEGTGLGLTICQRAINKHGGEIWVDSEIDKGSIFKFSFPLNQN